MYNHHEFKQCVFIIDYDLFVSNFFYSKTEYLQCDSLIIKIKKPIVGFDRGYLREKNKWIRLENIKFLGKKYVLYALKTNQKKYLNKDYRVDIKITKGINDSKFYDYQSVVSSDFCQIDGSNKCLKKNKGKNLQKGYCHSINYKE